VLIYNAEIKDKVIKSNEDFVWSLEIPLSGKFIIDVDFLDLKIASPDVYAYYLSLIILLIFCGIYFDTIGMLQFRVTIGFSNPLIIMIISLIPLFHNHQ
jgi:hypothetical protein